MSHRYVSLLSFVKKNYKTANNYTTAEARVKISSDLESLEF
jgi:hypothetical protein